MRTDVNPKDPTHSRDTAVQSGGTKNRLNVETHLKHISELLLSGFGGELSKPTLTGITDLARKAREGIDQLSVFSNSGNKLNYSHTKIILLHTIALLMFHACSKKTDCR